jgi:hypothetical protein
MEVTIHCTWNGGCVDHFGVQLGKKLVDPSQGTDTLDTQLLVRQG